MSIYETTAFGNQDELLLKVCGNDKVDLTVTAPSEFGGIDTEWSPEDLFSASISSCYILTFKFLARTKGLKWDDISVKVSANLEKTDKGLCFTTVIIEPLLTICCSHNVDPYLEALYKAKDNCLVTNSMKCEFEVKSKVKVKSK